jgi:hypothetical protein
MLFFNALNFEHFNSILFGRLNYSEWHNLRKYVIIKKFYNDSMHFILRQTLCTPVELFRDQLNFFTSFLPLCNLASMACYLIILAKIIIKKFSKNNLGNKITLNFRLKLMHLIFI